MRNMIFSALALASLAACAPKADHDELAAKVEALDARVAELEKGGRGSGSGRAAAPAVNAADEAKAQELFGQFNEKMGAGDMEGAKADLDKLFKDFGTTQTANKAIRYKRELDVIGTSVTNPTIEAAYVGQASDMDLQSGTTLVVFWEVWCPHCRREVPELIKTADKYKGKMDVVGLTRITKSATEEGVKEFVKEQGVTYTVLKENGDAAKAFAVSGIPAAAVVKDGKIVWRGHPGRLSDEMIEKYL
ncbi:MAG: TlpA disulfide reductase family protein [Myxococcota bacterium]|nr:TlpA disulfide reductase family protein [Myxococcota bacterium]